MNMIRTNFRLVQHTLILLVILLLPLTSGYPQNRGTADNIIVFPPPPDTARIQFLTSISGSSDIVGRPSFFKRYVLGSEPEKPILKPYGLTIHNKKLYICDTMLPGLEIIDFASKTFDYFRPSGMGQLNKPINCTLDDNGNLYVADAGRQQVVIFNANGNYLSSIGFGNESKPTDVKIYNQQLWICDLGTHQIRVAGLNSHQEIRAFPEPIPENTDYLFSPTNISIENDRIYVSDTGNASVKIFTPEGQFLGAVGNLGNAPGQFVRPKGIAADDENNLYVIDAAFENIQMFNEKSRLLMFFGGHTESPGHLWLPAGIVINAETISYFQKYKYEEFTFKYLIFVSNQFGPAKINVYGFIESKANKK
ncbi:6-bladed beta-propeller [candidate division KSB1 bacterium]|nr:6-bladed beta-propeller [candidate division KSB1 bacterium]